jgi:radical SAM protein with 4Fe4S-binding SPASM domain
VTPGFILRNFYSLVARRELMFQFDRAPLVAREISTKKLLNLFRTGVNRVFPVSRALGYPYMAHVSPSGLCDLRCDVCPAHDPRARGKALLPFQTYKRLIDEAGDYLLYVILWSWGEPFLNPDIGRMISYAREKNILTVTSTNMNRFNAELAREVVEAGLDLLIIALDGTTDETHSLYRRGGSAARVIENTRRLVEERRRRGQAKPFINLRMVVSRENEHQIEDFRSLAAELGVDMVSFKAFSTRQQGHADPRVDRQYAPDRESFRWYKYQPGYSVDKKPAKFNCKFPWTKPTLFADGQMLICEFDFQYSHSLGNLNEHSFREIWFGPAANALRKKFSRNRDGIPFCRDCVFDYKLIDGCVVDWDILRR